MAHALPALDRTLRSAVYSGDIRHRTRSIAAAVTSAARATTTIAIFSAFSLDLFASTSLSSALANQRNSLERDLDSLESALHFWTFLVVVGLVVEFWVIFHSYKDEAAAARAGMIKPPEYPSKRKYAVEFIATVLIAGGVAGELWAGLKTSVTSGNLRVVSHKLEAELSGDVAKANAQAAEAQKQAAESSRVAAEARERAAGNEREAARLSALAESERLARVRLEASLMDRTLTGEQRSTIIQKARRRQFLSPIKFLSVIGNREASQFGNRIASALAEAGLPVQWHNREFGQYVNPLSANVSLVGVWVCANAADSSDIQNEADAIGDILRESGMPGTNGTLMFKEGDSRCRNRGQADGSITIFIGANEANISRPK